MVMPKDPASKSSRKSKPVQYRSRHKRLDHLGEEVTKHGFKERLTVAGPTEIQSSERVFCGVWGINQAETEISEMEINNGNYRVALNHLEDRVRDRRPPRKSTPTTHNITSQYEPHAQGSHFSDPYQGSTSVTSMQCRPQRSTIPPQFGYSPEHGKGLPIAFPSVHFYRPAATDKVVIPQLPLPSPHFQEYDASGAPNPHQFGAYWYSNQTMIAMEGRDPASPRQTPHIPQPLFYPSNSSTSPLENYSNQPIPSGLEDNIRSRLIVPHAQQYSPEPPHYYESQPNDNSWDNLNAQPPGNSYHLNFQNVDPTLNAHSGNPNGYHPTPENGVFLGYNQYGGPFY